MASSKIEVLDEEEIATGDRVTLTLEVKLSTNTEPAPSYMFSRSRAVVATAESKDDGSTEEDDDAEGDSDDEEGNGDTKSHPRPPTLWLVVTNSHGGTEGSTGLVTVAPVIPGDKSPTTVVASF